MLSRVHADQGIHPGCEFKESRTLLDVQGKTVYPTVFPFEQVSRLLHELQKISWAPNHCIDDLLQVLLDPESLKDYI